MCPHLELGDQATISSLTSLLSPNLQDTGLGKAPFQKSAVFLNIVQKAFDPPPLLFEHLSYFAGGVFSCGEFFK